MNKTFYILLFFIFETTFVSSQQLPELSLRLFDQTSFNPAANGTNDYNQVMLHHRSQWVGFNNAPNTQFLTFNGKLQEYMGIGGLIMNDITGPTRRFSASVAYDYQLKFENFKLSLGIAAGIMQYGIDGNKITLYQNTDMAVAEQTSMRSISPNVDFGAWLYNNKFFAGVSILQLLSNKINLDNNDLNATIDQVNHFYITSGYTLDMNKNIKLQPSFLVCGTLSTPLLIDLGIKAEINDKFTAGLGFRTNDAVVILVGVKIKQHFTIAYSYDIIVSKLSKYNNGSHDIIMKIDFTNSKKKKRLGKTRHFK